MSDAYQAAIAEVGLEDVQPRYRAMLVELKSRDPEAYEAAVGRYKDEVESSTASGSELVETWIGYGAWLAARLAPGTLHSVDANGLAVPVGTPPPLGPFLMHLPDQSGERGRVVAMPAHPSDAQRETATLLCG